MPLKLLMTKKGNAFVAEDQFSIESMQKLKNDIQVRIVATVPRSLKQHRLLFGILSLVKDSQPEPRLFLTTDDVLTAIKEGLGYTERWVHLDGSVTFKPKSIDFATMDQADFNEFFESAVNLVITRILPNVKKKSFMRELFDMLKERGPWDFR